mmetsp:Transcript_89402/g.154785  ORF Transcript_89402/g.154785 Transcript_89402/m.154785 type:complete len:130 (+) Transcript_89402:154-543(+)
MSRPTWKQTFKPHRVAVDMGNARENFLYHKEMQAFPTARTVPGGRRGALGRGRVLMAQFRWNLQKLSRRVLPAPGNRVPVAFGFALPIVGMLAIGSFVLSATDLQREGLKIRDVMDKEEKSDMKKKTEV